MRDVIATNGKSDNHASDAKAGRFVAEPFLSEYGQDGPKRGRVSRDGQTDSYGSDSIDYNTKHRS